MNLCFYSTKAKDQWGIKLSSTVQIYNCWCFCFASDDNIITAEVNPSLNIIQLCWECRMQYTVSVGWLAPPLFVYNVVMCRLVNQVSSCSANYTRPARWEHWLVLQQHTAILIRDALMTGGQCTEYGDLQPGRLGLSPTFDKHMLCCSVIDMNTVSVPAPVHGAVLCSWPCCGRADGEDSPSCPSWPWPLPQHTSYAGESS